MTEVIQKYIIEFKRRWNASTPLIFHRMSIICTVVASMGAVLAAAPDIPTWIGVIVAILNGVTAMFAKLQEIK